MLLMGRLIDLYSLVVLVAVVISWVGADRRNPLLNPGVYTVHARGKNDTEGVALVEVYAVP